MSLDLSALTPLQVLVMSLVLAAVDTGWAIVKALSTGTFDPAKVAQFIQSHVLMRVFPILAMALLGSGQFGLPDFPPLFGAALAALAAYAVETVGSVIATAQSPAAPPAA